MPRLQAYRNPAKGWGLWGVFLNHDDRFIGWVLVRPMHFFSDQPHWNELELGWRFLRSHWGMGYATEAARHLMQHMQAAGYRHFSAIALPDNQGSIAIMQKLGMTFVARELHKAPVGEAVVDYYSVRVSD
ncbi:GNAT family N-acetyltransferase [Simiduia agarivorans]|uniref:N-acetyltransferase GCN5 n=1 Tax=Simiduia agarivorans (strain DSM 21679 / JCM 13881 / BCRC 17597 / SA1) TaxID=1117647 RepID=K4KMU8_SIMAS|nr:GNAT family N-acetyltransferase [Simiduia agarivorans]AFU99418.1 N-acetyltransferase GCN5 [Simiduia agarivorans SA1 = DSM 21679]